MTIKVYPTGWVKRLDGKGLTKEEERAIIDRWNAFIVRQMMEKAYGAQSDRQEPGDRPAEDQGS